MEVIAKYFQEEFSAKKRALSPAKQASLDLLFCLALAGTLATGSAFWVTRIAWTLLAIFFVLDVKYSVWAIFFHASFFVTAGFVPNLFFTLKHFHISLLITALVQALTNGFAHQCRAGFRIVRPMWPVFALVLVASLSGIVYLQKSILMRTGNLVSVFMALAYLAGFFENKEKYWHDALLAFVLGVSSQIAIALVNIAFHSNSHELNVIHNNHLGILSACSFFFACALSVISFKKVSRWLAVFVSGILLLSIVLSCSRTAWLSFIFALTSFFVLVWNNTKGEQVRRSFRFGLLILGGIFAVILTHQILTNYYVSQRILELKRLVDLESWRYTLYDSQNFGFFGIYRLTQLYVLGNLSPLQVLIGQGFSATVTDFHGLYFTIIGASGICGLILFALFTRNILRRLLSAIRSSGTNEEVLLRSAAFCSILVWLLSSFMETLLLQYSSWIPVLVGLLLTKPADSQRLYES